jgi:hypothetical protein
VSEETALIALEAQLKAELAALSGTTEPPSSNRISTKGKVFTLPTGESSGNPLNVVVLNFVAFNSYYTAAWNPNVRAKPACWALGRVLDEMVPSDKVPTPQHTDCKTCPKGQFGSAPNGGKGKACKNIRRLLVVPYGPEGINEKTEPMTLDVSPTGLKSWNKYVDRLRKEFAMAPLQVVTEVKFDPNQSFPSLQFDFVDQHANVELALRLKNLHSDLLEREPDLAEAA